MILVLLLFLLLFNFLLHIYCIILFFSKKDNKYIRWFSNTAILNIALAGSVTIYVMYKPSILHGFNLALVLWLLSGFVMLLAIGIKIVIFRRMYLRAKDPSNFHYNYFGKKVLHDKVMKKTEFYVFFGTIPFFLIFGAYFIVKIINHFMYGLPF
jgi:hypothetical protein